MRIALPQGDLAQLERRLRVESDPEGVEVIDLGLRALVVSCRRYEVMPPRLTLVRLGDHSLEIMLDPSSESRVPPPPFTTSPSSMTSWFLPREQTLLHGLRVDPEIGQMDPPYPSLVTVGRDEVGLVMVDLEQAGSLDLRGTNDEGILGTVAIEIATAKWADQVDLVLVGFDDEFESLDRVSRFATIADMLPRIQRRVRERKALLASVGRRANWEIRWTEGGDAWDLCVVICARRAIADDQAGAVALIELAGNGGLGLAVVLGSEVADARWHLDARDGRIELQANGSMASVVGPEDDDHRFSTGIASLLRVAGQLEGVAPTEPPYDQLSDRSPAPNVEAPDVHDDVPADVIDDLSVTETLRHRDKSFDVEVRVLGPVEIFGAARPFNRAWAVELIVYLAMHRNGASSEQWATALWPDKIMAPASLHSTASAARRSLGVSTKGEDHLPRAHGRLSLAPTVQSDWSRFVALSEREEPSSWQRALELIRGRPFEGLRAPDWVLLEGISANVEAVVVDLASRYAEYCLCADDPSGAEWSARQGLRVSAYDERLYRILLRAADRAGNPAGVESVMAELVRLVAEDVEPFDAVHPETLELYRSLSRRHHSIVES
jgi:DNA-binding SARP family transcriptional activator